MENGRGVINILHAVTLFESPDMYAAFLLWLLTTLFSTSPEVGDLDKPKLVFFFDEAHLLFNDAPKALIDKIEQVVRLIRSKGVSVWFITQNPTDIPDNVLGQIGNRVQHALRAYTANDQKALRAAANSFRTDSDFDVEEAIQTLGVGEALVSVLDEKGIPTIVEKANILPPRSSMKALDAVMLQANVLASPLKDKYAQAVDQESAYELLQEEQAAQEQAELEEKAAIEEQKRAEQEAKQREREMGRAGRNNYGYNRRSNRRSTTPIEKALNSTANTIGREIGKTLIRGLFDTLRK